MIERTNTEETIKEGTKYTRSGIVKSFSGSQFGNTLLQNYLITLYGNVEEPSIGQADIGSVFHKGMEDLYLNKTVDKNRVHAVETKVSKVLPNGWTLTGTIDRIDIPTNRDTQSIHDYKLTKKYSGKTVHKEWYHPYKLQLNSYKYSMDIPEPTNMFLELFYKDADALLKEQAYEQIEVPFLEDFEEIAVKVTDELEAAIDSGETPPECTAKEKWLRKLKTGNTVPSRCVAYCSVSSKCPYYKETMKNTIANW